jgi:hypothetical protein
MACFGALLAVCASLDVSRAEEPLRLAMDLPDFCLAGCQATPLAFENVALTLRLVALASQAGESWARSAVASGAAMPSLTLSTDHDVMVHLLRRRLPTGAPMLEVPSGFPPIAAAGAASDMDAGGGLFGIRRTKSRLIAECIPNQCTLTLLAPTNKRPSMVFEGGRNSAGEMGGQLALGSWFRATGRVSFDGGNRILVHMQDVGFGRTEVVGGRLIVGGTFRNTFRYFDTRDVRGLSLSAETGPVLAVNLPGSGDVLSVIATAGPDVLFAGRVSGTANLGLLYAR